MHQSRTGLILAGIAALLLLTSCGGGGGGSTPANVAPTANAGSPQTVSAGATVTLNGTASSDSDGSIAGYAWTQTTGTAVTLSSASSAQPSFTAPAVVATTSLTFRLVVTDNRGAASAGSTVAITVNPVVVAPVTVTGLVRFARVPFLGASPFGLNYANATLRPSRGVVVRALNAGTQAILATGVTDASGNYSLSVASNTSITIQVVARMLRDTSQLPPRWDVRVQDGQLTTVAPYTFTTAPFNSSLGAQNVDILTGISAGGTATGVRDSGPFAVLDTIYTAMQTVIGAAPTITFPPLIVDWGSQSTGTFFTASTAQHIALLADLTEDTDEFDQHVIAHEFGHYLEYNFSRADNIGGSHSFGDRLDMRVAFGEGWGYAFAAIALGDPIALDSYVDTGVQRAGGFNVETNPPLPSGAGAGCWCSESSVQSIIYDLYDSNPDGADGISLGFQPIWDVLTSTQRTTTSVTSIFSFIAALKAAQPASAGLINALVAAQNINSAGIDAFATAETNTPYPGLLPLFPIITVGGPSVVVRSIDDSMGHYNKAGNRGFLRFTPTSSGTVTVRVNSSNPDPNRDPDFVVFRSGTPVALGDDPPADPEVETFSVTAGTTYVIDAYDCANGCSGDTVQGTQGDYNMTVTIN